ncbi:MAG: flagellar export chaperone FliS [Planctomycetota bacterium]
MSAQPTSAYLESIIESAPPIKIVRLLYEKALQLVERARRIDPAQNRTQFAETISKADAIVVELRLSLDRAPAPDIADSLEGLYLFCEEQFSEATASSSHAPLDGVTRVLSTLLDAWRRIEIDTTGQGRAAA